MLCFVSGDTLWGVGGECFGNQGGRVRQAVSEAAYGPATWPIFSAFGNGPLSLKKPIYPITNGSEDSCRAF